METQLLFWSQSVEELVKTTEMQQHKRISWIPFWLVRKCQWTSWIDSNPGHHIFHCVHHFRRTICYIHALMHSTADSGSWFSPKRHSSSISWFCSRSDHVLSTNKPLQSLFESRPRPPLRGGITTLVWSAFGAHRSTNSTFTPAQMNRTERELLCDSTKLNEAGVKSHLGTQKKIFSTPTDFNSANKNK